MRLMLFTIVAGVVVLGIAACGGDDSATTTPTASQSTTTAAASTTAAAAATNTGSLGGQSSAAPSVASGTGSVTFDGAYSGTLVIDQCVGSGANTTASVKAAFDGSTTTYAGDISANEYGFQGPDGAEFDSGFLSTSIDPNGSGFDFDGTSAKDASSGKTLNLHGTLVCS
ncbi:MAG: hypothetical protein ABI559_04865 [Chloroflexota bacterium]